MRVKLNHSYTVNDDLRVPCIAGCQLPTLKGSGGIFHLLEQRNIFFKLDAHAHWNVVDLKDAYCGRKELGICIFFRNKGSFWKHLDIIRPYFGKIKI
jgi:hypothetical protein